MMSSRSIEHTRKHDLYIPQVMVSDDVSCDSAGGDVSVILLVVRASDDVSCESAGGEGK